MLNALAHKFALMKLKKNVRENLSHSISFNGFVSNSETFLMLVEEGNVKSSTIAIAEYLNGLGKKLSVLTTVNCFDKFFVGKKIGFLEYSEQNKNKYHLPTKDYLAKMRGHFFDCIIDLTDSDELFFPLITSVIKCSYRVGKSNRKFSYCNNLLVEASDNESDFNEVILEYLKRF